MLQEIVLFLVLLLGTLVIVLARFKPTQYDHIPDSPVSRDRPAKNGKASVQILVLGDIGHSPRMQNHALSIAKHGGHVSIIGYKCMLVLIIRYLRDLVAERLQPLYLMPNCSPIH